jgi:glutamyl-tRNA synthetase/nondiscriminating glutamyl-tRNA synthetase
MNRVVDVFISEGYLTPEDKKKMKEELPLKQAASFKVEETVLGWLTLAIFKTVRDRPDTPQLREVGRLIFEYDAARVVGAAETRDAAEDPSAREILKAFIPKILALDGLTYDRFREIAKEVQMRTGKKGRELFHPIRVAVTGAVSGPELEKLIPIFEEGSKLSLARPVKATAQRLREFAEAARLL